MLSQGGHHPTPLLAAIGPSVVANARGREKHQGASAGACTAPTTRSPRAQIDPFMTEMSDAKVDWQVVLYADTDHGFTATQDLLREALKK